MVIRHAVRADRRNSILSARRLTLRRLLSNRTQGLVSHMLPRVGTREAVWSPGLALKSRASSLGSMLPLSQTTAPWHEFYSLLGQASATMTGLLFVAVSVGSSVFSKNRPGALRMFLSASVVQFGCILIGCLMILAPIQKWEALGGVILVCGLFGVGYSVVAWRDTVNDGLSNKIDLEDRAWYAVAPAIGYLIEVAGGILLILHSGLGPTVLGLSLVALLLVAIHNAWDITLWSATRRNE